MLNRRPYLDIGIAVLKRVQNGVELIDIKDLVSERQCELDIELEPGTYIILPRTSGCMLRRPSFAEHESIRLMDHNKNFHPIVVQHVIQKNAIPKMLLWSMIVVVQQLVRLLY